MFEFIVLIMFILGHNIKSVSVFFIYKFKNIEIKKYNTKKIEI